MFPENQVGGDIPTIPSLGGTFQLPESGVRILQHPPSLGPEPLTIDINFLEGNGMTRTLRLLILVKNEKSKGLTREPAQKPDFPIFPLEGSQRVPTKAPEGTGNRWLPPSLTRLLPLGYISAPPSLIVTVKNLRCSDYYH